MRWFAVLALLTFWLDVAVAQPLEIITLRHRTAEQVLSQLTPLLEPTGALSGTGDKLFLRASPRNKADLLRALDALDKPPRRLLITVRQDGHQEMDSRGGVYSSRGRRSDNVSQRVQTIEGGRAHVNVGQPVALPLTQAVLTPRGVVVSETVVWRELGTGFSAEPRLAGERVTLEISPTHDTPGATPGSANIQRLSTTVSGRLGEWISLGGAARDNASERAGTTHYGTRSNLDSRQVWLKVEELP